MKSARQAFCLSYVTGHDEAFHVSRLCLNAVRRWTKRGVKMDKFLKLARAGKLMTRANMFCNPLILKNGTGAVLGAKRFVGEGCQEVLI
jgi:hypothetical protein